MSAIEAFLREIDLAWRIPASAKIRLRIIGSTALMLQADYLRGTKDSDVLETDALSKDTQDSLLEIAGPDTVVHRRHNLYLDIVRSGLPFLPQVPLCHVLSDLNSSLQHFEIEVLDIVDVVVSKLKRFSVHDRDDISANRNRIPCRGCERRSRSCAKPQACPKSARTACADCTPIWRLPKACLPMSWQGDSATNPAARRWPTTPSPAPCAKYKPTAPPKN